MKAVGPKCITTKNEKIEIRKRNGKPSEPLAHLVLSFRIKIKNAFRGRRKEMARKSHRDHRF